MPGGVEPVAGEHLDQAHHDEQRATMPHTSSARAVQVVVSEDGSGIRTAGVMRFWVDGDPARRSGQGLRRLDSAPERLPVSSSVFRSLSTSLQPPPAPSRRIASLGSAR